MILPIFSFMSRAFAAGDFPFWIDSIMGGFPLYNIPQFSALYPFYFLNQGIYSTPLDALRQIHWVLLFHYFLLLINTYIFLRILGLSIIGGILGASLFSFSPNMLSYAYWVNIVAPYAWMPLVLASVILILNLKNVKVGVYLGIFSISMLVLASPSHPLIHSVFISAVFFAWYLLKFIKSGQSKKLKRAIFYLATMSLGAFLISGPSLLPALLDMDEMIRWIGPFPPVLGNAKIPFAGFIIGQAEIQDWANVYFPLKKSYLLGNSYVGWVALFLCSLSVFQAKRHPIIWPVLFLVFYGWVSSFGDNLFLATVNYHLPFMDKIREPGRHLVFFILGTSILSGFGFMYLQEIVRQGYKSLFQVKHGLVTGVFILMGLKAYMLRLEHEVHIPDGATIGLFVIFFGLLVILPALKEMPRSLGFLILASMAVFSYIPFPLNAPAIKDGDYFSEINTKSHEVLEEVSKIPDIRNYRVLFEGGLDKSRWAMNGIYYDIRSFNAYFNPLPHRQFRELFYHGKRFDNYYPLLGAKYLICDECDPETVRGYRLQKEISGYKLFVNEKAVPKYFVVSNVQGSFTGENQFYDLIHAGFDYGRSVYLSRNDFDRVTPKLDSKKYKSICQLKSKHRSLNKLKVFIRCDAPGIFVLNEYFSKNWKAKADGKPQNVLKVNLNQMGFYIEAGEHLIEWEYHPTLLINLMRLQKGTMILVMVGLFAWSFPPWILRTILKRPI